MSAFKCSQQGPACTYCFPLSPCLSRCPTDSDGCDTVTQKQKAPFPWSHSHAMAGGNRLEAIYSLRGFTLPKLSWNYELDMSDRILDWTCSHRAGQRWMEGTLPATPSRGQLTPDTDNTQGNSWHQNWVLNTEQVHHKAFH